MKDSDDSQRNDLIRQIDAAILDGIPAPNRPMAPVQWYGGKGKLASKILPLLPTGKIYVEPFCGAASMYWHQNPPPPVVVLNDIDGELINLFRCLQSTEIFPDLLHKVLWTPYSLDAFREALKMHKDASPMDRAWAFFVRQDQGFGGHANSEGDWGRVFTSSRGMAMKANGWRGRMKLLNWWHDRLTSVQIDSRDALEVIAYWDSPDTIFYLDPPYALDTRVKGSRDVYSEEPDDNFHAKLVKLLLKIQGKAMLSGYATPIYEPLVDAGWERVDIKTVCHAAGRTRGSGIQGKGSALDRVPRIETLWIKGTPAGNIL